LFGGFMSDDHPFGGSIDALIAGGEITYQGDDGQRSLQVSSSRYIEISDSGLDVFRRMPNGNGYFVTGYASRQYRHGIDRCRFGERSGGLAQRGQPGGRSAVYRHRRGHHL
jgi:flagellar hook-associated protein 3 FlgL